MELLETEGILDLVKKSESAREKCKNVLSASLSFKVGFTFVIFLSMLLLC